MATIDFCSLGMFIIDDIHPSPSDTEQRPHLNVLGGAGTYSALGARLLYPPPLAQRIGWIVDCGTDFPSDSLDTINEWHTGVLLRKRDGLTTKGWNGYGANEHRAFRYLTPKLRLTADDLSSPLLSSKSFHLICSPLRGIELVKTILQRRKAAHPDLPRPLFIWEPVPDLCVPDELANTLEAIKLMDVISPNHAELASIFGVQASDDAGNVDRPAIEHCASKLLAAVEGIEHRLAVIVRSGRDGCFIDSSVYRTDGSQPTWVPAYHDKAPTHVIDPTGGGNGFLGGFAVGLVRTADPVRAAICGSVGASFCIEQVGVPLLQRYEDGAETWNGEVVLRRLAELGDRCGYKDIVDDFGGSEI